MVPDTNPEHQNKKMWISNHKDGIKMVEYAQAEAKEEFKTSKIVVTWDLYDKRMVEDAEAEERHKQYAQTVAQLSAVERSFLKLLRI